MTTPPQAREKRCWIPSVFTAASLPDDVTRSDRAAVALSGSHSAPPAADPGYGIAPILTSPGATRPFLHFSAYHGQPLGPAAVTSASSNECTHASFPGSRRRSQRGMAVSPGWGSSDSRVLRGSGEVGEGANLLPTHRAACQHCFRSTWRCFRRREFRGQRDRKSGLRSSDSCQE